MRAPLVLLSFLCLGACRPVIEPPLDRRLSVDVEADRVRFAIIGDYGKAGPAEAAVATMVERWKPDFIITTGDNNYPCGDDDTIDENVGQYYHAFIFPYLGRFGDGADTNLFFPVPGNHDWRAPGLRPYLEYFTLPGNERYYELRWGPVHLFALDSDRREPDGRRRTSRQAAWLEERLSASTTSWQIVYFHEPPYSSSRHGGNRRMRWPFAAWGADAIVTGHDHVYERIDQMGIPYFVNGLGGHPDIYRFRRRAPGSQVRFNGEHGAMLVEATSDTLLFRFVTISGEVVDEVELRVAESG